MFAHVHRTAVQARLMTGLGLRGSGFRVESVQSRVQGPPTPLRTVPFVVGGRRDFLHISMIALSVLLLLNTPSPRLRHEIRLQKQNVWYGKTNLVEHLISVVVVGSLTFV